MFAPYVSSPFACSYFLARKCPINGEYGIAAEHKMRNARQIQSRNNSRLIALSSTPHHRVLTMTILLLLSDLDMGQARSEFSSVKCVLAIQRSWQDKGGGEPLKDEAPFVSITVCILECGGSVDGLKAPDLLCKQCRSIFKKEMRVMRTMFFRSIHRSYLVVVFALS